MLSIFNGIQWKWRMVIFLPIKEEGSEISVIPRCLLHFFCIVGLNQSANSRLGEKSRFCKFRQKFFVSFKGLSIIRALTLQVVWCKDWGRCRVELEQFGSANEKRESLWLTNQKQDWLRLWKRRESVWDYITDHRCK